MMDKRNGRWLTAGVILLIVLIGALALIYPRFAPKGLAGSKQITVEVITPDSSKEYQITTQAEFLRGALEQEELIQGEEGSFGMYVEIVDGISADKTKQEWWKLSKDGEMLSTSVDQTPVADGGHYEITLTKGW